MNYFSFMKHYPSLFENNNAPIRIMLDRQEIETWHNDRLKELVEKSQPENWADIGVVFDDPHVIVFRDLVEFPGGHRVGLPRLFNRAFLEGGAQGVVVLPEYEGKIMLLHQYRHPIRQWCYEIPRGYGEPSVSAEENACKEIEEETGGRVGELFNLGEFHNNTGFDATTVSLFCAKLAFIGTPDESAGIESFIWLTVKELEKWIADGEITDGFTIAAYTRAKLKGLI